MTNLEKEWIAGWKEVLVLNYNYVKTHALRSPIEQYANLSVSELCFSNITPWSPIFMYCPEIIPSADTEDLNKAFRNSFSLSARYSTTKRRLLKYKRYYSTQSFRSRSTSFWTKRGEQRISVRIGFLHAFRDIEKQERPNIMWAGVVPSSKSLEFHHRILNKRVINPKQLGLEFWYNKEYLKSDGTFWRSALANGISDQAIALGLKPVAKTNAEMNSLVFDTSHLIEKHRTVMEVKAWRESVMEEVISGTQQEVIFTGPTTREALQVPDLRVLMPQILNDQAFDPLTINELSDVTVNQMMLEGLRIAHPPGPILIDPQP